MKKIITLFVSLFTFNVYAIPTSYKSSIKQTIYEYIKNRDNKEALMGYISLFRDSAIRNKNAIGVFQKYDLIIYYLSVFDVENTPEELDNIMINSIDSLKFFTSDSYYTCVKIGRKVYYNY